MNPYLQIIRPWQWYKNLLIFIALLFSGNLFNFLLYPKLIVGFFLLCFISGANYILNDLKDLERDKKDPEKRKRPLPSGKITKLKAVFYFFFLLTFSLGFSLILDFYFFLSVLSLFVLSTFYSLYLKNIPIVDILIISINFVVRAVSGCFLINVGISFWLVLCTFLLALLLATSKRKGEISALGRKGREHRKVLDVYSKEFLDMLLIISASSLLLSYGMYCFLAYPEFPSYLKMFLSFPIASFLIFRYLLLVFSENIGKEPGMSLKDRQMLIGIILWIIAVIFSLYF